MTIPSVIPEDAISPLIIAAEPETETAELADLDALPIVNLNNADFAQGTLCITESSGYVLTEDIVLRVNEPSAPVMASADFSSNVYDADELYWFPTCAQSEYHGAYPGLYAFHSKFALGFFAGISIECNDVMVNLNEYSLQMSDTLYFQQHFFSLIELGN